VSVPSNRAVVFGEQIATTTKTAATVAPKPMPRA
jgi:hypothetical protein